MIESRRSIKMECHSRVPAWTCAGVESALRVNEEAL